MILGRSDTPGYLQWAQEAVRVAELGISEVLKDGKEPMPGTTKLLASCKKVLENAEADFDEFGYPTEDEEEEDEDAVTIWTAEDCWLDEPKEAQQTIPTNEVSTLTASTMVCSGELASR